MANGKRKPQLYVIAGPNGAGKTTFAREFLPNEGCMEFVNADLIAGGLSPFAPETAAIQAGRIMLGRIHALGAQRTTFGLETTLSGRGHLNLFKNLKQKGYSVHVFFLWLQSVELALKRVADRIRLGGHNIPPNVIRRRYAKGLRNLFGDYYSTWDSIALHDNSGSAPVLVYSKSMSKELVLNEMTYQEIIKRK